MAPAAVKPAAPRNRNRNRKRKRRAASSSSSSDSSSSSGSDEAKPPTVPVRLPSKAPVQESSDSPSSSSESDSDSAGDSPVNSPVLADPAVAVKHTTSWKDSPSPSPPPATIPSFIPPIDATEGDATHPEQIIKDRFRKFWMASVADGFKDDLEQIRKEPNLGTSRLSLLIDSLASGADVFVSGSHKEQKDNINEMEVVLE